MHTVTWSMCRFLATIATCSAASLSIADRSTLPDFELVTDATRTGIEVTEASAADLAWADAIAERDGFDATRMFQRGLGR